MPVDAVQSFLGCCSDMGRAWTDGPPQLLLPGWPQRVCSRMDKGVGLSCLGPRAGLTFHLKGLGLSLQAFPGLTYALQATGDAVLVKRCLRLELHVRFAHPPCSTWGGTPTIQDTVQRCSLSLMRAG